VGSGRAVRLVPLAAVATTLLVARPSVAQDDGATLQTWTDYTSLYWMTHNLRYTGDYGIRGAIANRDWTTIYARPDAAWHAFSWFTVTGGVGGFYTFQDADQFELRPFVGATAVWPELGRWRFDHYLRLEWRNVWTYDSTTTFDGDLRLRYRIRVHTPSFGRGFNGLPFYGAASFEAFTDTDEIAEQFANRTRSTLVLGHLVTQRWRLEFHFTLQSSKSSPEASFDLSDVILRLRVRHHIN
jgi:hypothetical protein